MTICGVCGALVTDKHPAAFLCPMHSRLVPHLVLADYKRKSDKLVAYRRANPKGHVPRRLVLKVGRAWIVAREAAREASRRC